jgi:hypothetical protein
MYTRREIARRVRTYVALVDRRIDSGGEPELAEPAGLNPAPTIAQGVKSTRNDCSAEQDYYSDTIVSSTKISDDH